MLQTLNQLQKHTRRVLITKRTLPIFAFLLIALIIVWPLFKEQKDSFSLGISSSKSGKGVKMDMENIRFFAINTKKLPMTLVTPSAKEINPSTHEMRMENPVGTYQMANNEVLTIKTPYAFIHQEKETVLFEDEVNIVSSSGYQGNTRNVFCDYKQGTADSNEPVFITGPMGKVNAKGLLMKDKGNSIFLKQDFNATIYRNKEQVKISSPDGAEVNQVKKTLSTLGKTTVYHQGNILKANKIVAYYTNNKENQIEKIIATGNVSIDNGKQKMFGDKGTYYPSTKKIFMEGNVKLSQGKNEIKGDKATLDLISGESDLKATERIKGQLVPDQFKGGKK